MKKILALVMVILLITVSAVPAFAASLSISACNTSATKTGSSIVVSSYTTANQTADMVGGTIYLQIYVEDAWQTVAGSSSTFFGYGVTTKSGSKTYSANGGYTYRVKVVHKASLGTETVTRTFYTASLSF